MLKIAFDHQIFSLQAFGGISRYYTELFTRFRKTEGIELVLPLSFSNNHYLEALPELRHRPLLKNRHLPGKRSLLYYLNQPRNLWSMLSAKYQIFHPTYYQPYFLRHIGDTPFVLTVYDMIHELLPQEYNARTDVSRQKKILIEKASRIIAISENTKRDILNFHKVDESKIRVIHLGDSLSHIPEDAGPRPELPDKYILFVGNRGSYKNFLFFLESIGDLFLQDRDLHLICVGGGAFSNEETKRFQHLGISKRVRVISSPDGKLAGYYRNAALFAFPSLYEGFGIPVLEAFAGGCPMALSRASSLPEIAGEAGAYFDPKDRHSIHSAVKTLLNDSALRENLVRLGRERLKTFDWDNTARDTLALYREILEETGGRAASHGRPRS